MQAEAEPRLNMASVCFGVSLGGPGILPTQPPLHTAMLGSISVIINAEKLNLVGAGGSQPLAHGATLNEGVGSSGCCSRTSQVQSGCCNPSGPDLASVHTPHEAAGSSPAVMGMQIHPYGAWALQQSQEQARFVVAWKRTGCMPPTPHTARAGKGQPPLYRSKRSTGFSCKNRKPFGSSAGD